MMLHYYQLTVDFWYSGSLLLQSGQVPGVLVWDFSTGSLLSDLKGHQCGVQSVDFSEDG